MKKYKLIKPYPGSPKLNHIVMKETNVPYYGNSSAQFHEIIIENQPEFWEEIIEKDYEILSFINVNSKIYSLQKDGTYFNSELKYNPYEYCLRVLKIHSIKRTLDNEIFTIGDTVELNAMWGNTCKIKEINVYNNEVSFTIQENLATSAYRKFKEFKKVKQPLFTTEDDVDIFKNDTYYVVAKQDIYESTINSEYDIKAFDIEENSKDFEQYNWNNFWSFSTKEKAEEHILMNKPCLSINDVINTSYNPVESKTSLIIKLKELLNSKLNK